MRLALLGLDETSSAIALAIASGGRDVITLACDVHPDDVRLLSASVAPSIEPWEVLLTWAAGALPCDAVIVAGDDDEERRLEQLRRLAQAGMPLLISHPVHRSMLAHYELDMIRRETGAILVPCLPARSHPLAAQLSRLVEEKPDSHVGEVDQVIFERALEARSRENVVRHFARDVDLLRFVAGEVHQLGAMGSPGTAASGELLAYHNLAVQMSGTQGRVVRWSIHPTHEFAGARLTLSGSRGKAVLHMPPQPEGWSLETKAPAESTTVEGDVWDPHTAALEELRDAIGGGQASRWPDAARAVELAETIERSLAKGKVIDLVEQEYSDVSTFKGMMTSIGCGLLVASLAAAVAAILMGNLLKHAGFLQAAKVVGAVPYFLLAALVLFLALQALLKLVQPSSERTNSAAQQKDGE
jgi:hypothetical protein